MKRRQVKRSYQYSSLSGSKQSKGETKNPQKSPSGRKWWRSIWHYSPYGIGAIVIIYLVLFSNIFQINTINVQGPNTALSQDLQRGTEQYLDARLFGRNWLFVNTQDLRNTLQKSFSGQESIAVDKVFASKLVIKTDEQKPAIAWKTGSRRFVISVNGRVMSELQPNQDSSYVVVTDNSNIPVSVGDNVAGREFVAFTTAVADYMKANNLGPTELYISETTGELNAKSSQGYIIKLDATTDPAAQIRSLQAIIDHLKSTNKKPNEYIDLRIEGKAFYR